MRKLVAGLEWASGSSHQWSIPPKAALFQARKRLGSQPLRLLYETIAVPLARPAGPGQFLSVVTADECRRVDLGRAGL